MKQATVKRINNAVSLFQEKQALAGDARLDTAGQFVKAAAYLMRAATAKTDEEADKYLVEVIAILVTYIESPTG